MAATRGARRRLGLVVRVVGLRVVAVQDVLEARVGGRTLPTLAPGRPPRLVAVVDRADELVDPRRPVVLGRLRGAGGVLVGVRRLRTERIGVPALVVVGVDQLEIRVVARQVGHHVGPLVAGLVGDPQVDVELVQTSLEVAGRLRRRVVDRPRRELAHVLVVRGLVIGRRERLDAALGPVQTDGVVRCGHGRVSCSFQSRCGRAPTSEWASRLQLTLSRCM